MCGVFCAVATAACNEGGPPASCPTPGATFIVTLSAGGNTLPQDTEVTLRFGGQVDVYRLAAPCCPKVMFCNPVALDGGAVDAGPAQRVEALRCEIWTGGSATLLVRASTYSDLSEELLAKSDDCGGVLTQNVPLELEPLDAGP